MVLNHKTLMATLLYIYFHWKGSQLPSLSTVIQGTGWVSVPAKILWVGSRSFRLGFCTYSKRAFNWCMTRLISKLWHRPIGGLQSSETCLRLRAWQPRNKISSRESSLRCCARGYGYPREGGVERTDAPWTKIRKDWGPSAIPLIPRSAGCPQWRSPLRSRQSRVQTADSIL